MFIRCSGDEAAAALSATQFITWLNMKASKMLLDLPCYSQDKDHGFFWRSFVLLVSYASLLFFREVLMPVINTYDGPVSFLKSLTTPPDLIEIAVFSLAVAGSCLFVLVLLVVFFIFLAQAITSRAFGWTQLIRAFS